MGLLSRNQIAEMGFAHVGENAHLSDKASYYNCANIIIGDNVRIDDFCILSAGKGGIAIGNYVHIAAYSCLIGTSRIILHDFCGLSSRVSIYSSSDDYSGTHLTNPTIPEEFTGVQHADVEIEKHSIVGAGSVILPGVTLEIGVAIGALSLVTKKCREFGIYSGVPARRIKERKRDLLLLEQTLLASKQSPR